MKNIVITCALASEFNEARNQLKLKEITNKKDIPRIAQQGSITLILTGLGKINTIINLFPYLEKNKPDLVIDSGTCGSLDNKSAIHDIVVSNKAIDFFDIENYNSSILIGDLEHLKTILKNIEYEFSTVASIEKSIVDEYDVNKLLASGASVVTWETSSVFNVCSKLGINFISIRGVTDNCNGSTLLNFKKNRVETCKKLYISVKKLCNGI